MDNVNLITLVGLIDCGSQLYLWNPRTTAEEELTPYDVARLGHRVVSRIAVYDNTKTVIYLREEDRIPVPTLLTAYCNCRA